MNEQGKLRKEINQKMYVIQAFRQVSVKTSKGKIWSVTMHRLKSLKKELRVICYKLREVMLLKKLGSRYTFTLEYGGFSKPRIIARFCGDFIGSHETRLTAIKTACCYEDLRVNKMFGFI